MKLDQRSIGEVLRGWSVQSPSAPAARSLDHDELATLTYGELHELGSRLGERLRALVPGGRTVAVCAVPSLDSLVLEYAAAIAGVPLVPVNPTFADEEIEYILRTSLIGAVLADAEFRGAALLTRLVEIGQRLDVAVAELRAWRSLPPGDAGTPAVDTNDTFLIQYTSGTTGRPKGAVLSRRAAFNCARISMQTSP